VHSQLLKSISKIKLKFWQARIIETDSTSTSVILGKLLKDMMMATDHSVELILGDPDKLLHDGLFKEVRGLKH